ncbi:MAG: hypothetical protein IPP38_10200 [Bacteroidetes bacterium]|nr:hypothetical protein [Bacteroidota bacterium]
MRKLYFLLILIILATKANAQDESFATPLCGGFVAQGSLTVGTTPAVNDPALDCK